MIGLVETEAGEWHGRFMELAHGVAAWSKDPNRKVGAVVVSADRRKIHVGYNGFPRGVADLRDRLKDQDLKRLLMVHAELNAILNAATDLAGWTLYCTSAPCLECAKAIVQAGIARVVCPPFDPSHPAWGKSHRDGQSLMVEAGVTVSVVQMPVPSERD